MTQSGDKRFQALRLAPSEEAEYESLQKRSESQGYKDHHLGRFIKRGETNEQGTPLQAELFNTGTVHQTFSHNVGPFSTFTPM